MMRPITIFGMERGMGYRKRSVGLGVSLCLLGQGVWAAEGAAACAAEAGDQARLACYDRLFRSAPAAPVVPEAGRPAALQPDRAAADGMLTERWGLSEDAERRLFRIHAYRPTYILPVRWSNAPNHQPTSPNPDNQVSSPDSLKAAEAKYQISFKTLAYSDHWFGQRADLWLG
jgi:phospholipase A1